MKKLRIFSFFCLLSLVHSTLHAAELDASIATAKTGLFGQTDADKKAADQSYQESVELLNQFTYNIDQACTVGTGSTAACETTSRSAQQLYDSCMKSYSIAKATCEAQKYAPYIAPVLSMGFSATQSAGGDSYKQCKNAALISGLLGAASLGISGTCGFTHGKCEQACGQLAKAIRSASAKLNSEHVKYKTVCTGNVVSDNVDCTFTEITLPKVAGDLDATAARFNALSSTCADYEVDKMGMVISGMQTFQAMAQSQSCQKALTDECTTPEASTNPKCTYAFCANPTNKNHPTCKAMWDQCTQNPAAPTCVCLSNPSDPSCASGTVGLQGDLGSPSTVNPNYNGIDDFTSDQANPIAPGGPGAKSGIVGGNGGGASGGTGGGSPLGGGPGGGGGGGNKPVYDTNVMGGVGSSAGAGGGYPSAGGGYANGAAAGSGYSGTYKPGANPSLDLKKYLPGGAMAQQRDTTSLNAKGITPANGLSNWEKVTRSLNNNRSRLVKP